VPWSPAADLMMIVATAVPRIEILPLPNSVVTVAGFRRNQNRQ
jgi:hypothetical protein